ncbi:two-component system response regulator [Patescibacteria group bacterium]
MKKKILIIEDEKALIKALADTFKKEEYEVLQARNGEDGLAIALDKRPDIILLDIIMPVMDGITMLKKLREDPWGSEAKVMILSNLSSDQKVDDAIENRAYDFLVKTDWTLAELVKKVKERLSE